MAKACPTPQPFRAVIGTVAVVSLLFFYTFVARFIFSPLFPSISTDLGLKSGQAGSLFLLGALGMLVGSFSAGVVSSWLKHRGTLILSVLGMSAVLVGAHFASSLWALRAVFIVLGAFAGIQMPSSIATITGTVKPDDWGKALSVQQMAPPLSLVVGPLFAAGMLTAFSWNTTLLWVAGLGVVLALVFMFGFGGIGAFPGDVPDLEHARPVLATRSFWVMIFLFALGMGAQVGIFTMLPLYLTQERGMTEGHANTILGLSNIAPLAVVFLSGWITTKIGPRPTMALFLALTGATVVLVGLLSGTAMVVCVFLMAALAVGFFAPAFASLSRIVQPTMRSLAAGFGPPVAFLLGGGLLPLGLGYLGQTASFALGITITGAVIVVGSAATMFLKLLTDLEEGC
jgi:MFS transporter, NNP family, nitrate/nitrite transporter